MIYRETSILLQPYSELKGLNLIKIAIIKKFSGPRQKKNNHKIEAVNWNNMVT